MIDAKCEKFSWVVATCWWNMVQTRWNAEGFLRHKVKWITCCIWPEGDFYNMYGISSLDLLSIFKDECRQYLLSAHLELHATSTLCSEVFEKDVRSIVVFGQLKVGIYFLYWVFITQQSVMIIHVPLGNLQSIVIHLYKDVKELVSSAAWFHSEVVIKRPTYVGSMTRFSHKVGI